MASAKTNTSDSAANDRSGVNPTSKPTTSNVPTNSAPVSARALSGIPSPNLKPSSNSSRNTSPTRRANPSTASPSLQSLQSARARSAALSPTRSLNPTPGASTPSATAVQRALSAADMDPSKAFSKAVPSQNQGSDPASIASPPTSTASSRRSSLSSSKQSESGDASSSASANQRSSDLPEKNLSPTQVQPRTPRGPSGLASRLETVEERDHSGSPNNRVPLSESSPANPAKQATAGTTVASSMANTDRLKPSQSEHKSTSAEKSTAVQPAPPSRKPSTSSLAPTKTRTNAEGSKHMTVETETVQSIPQAALSAASDRAASTRSNTAGNVRPRPSNETIRPKKDKKKMSKKPPPVVSGPNSTKAELFEAVVASEIDAESTDSDETFVYESNPAETQSRSRHHSRTPSTTSLASAADRPRAGLSARALTGGELSTDRPVRPKRSMKFASNSYAGSSIVDETTDTAHETIRTQPPRATPRHDMFHKHVGRLPRDAGNGSDSPLESDSPFSQAQRMRPGNGAGWRSPKGRRSPGSNTPAHTRTPTKKAFDTIPFELHGSGTSDDERAPLLRPLRHQRVRGGPHHLRNADLYRPPPRRVGAFGTFTSCLLLAAAAVLLTAFGGAFIFATSKPLYGVSVMEIQNVLASEQEIMLDLLVQATNPNIAQITVSNMDVNVFAKSRYVADPRDPDQDRGDNVSIGPGSHRGRKMYRPTGPQLAPVRQAGGTDHGTDPICPPWEPDCDTPGAERDQQTMLLGRIFHFDSALSFEPSPIRRLPTNSSGELRLARPGNKTESGGSERWERVIQHPFELILRGILKYQLPLSTRVQTKSVGASVLVHPEEGVNERGVMRVIQLGRLLPSEDYESGKTEEATREPNGEVKIPERGDGWVWAGG